MLAKLGGLSVLLITENANEKFFFATIIYFGGTIVNHAVNGPDHKSLIKILPTAVIGWVLNFIILTFFMAPIFSNLRGVISLAFVTNIHGFVNIAMFCENPIDLLSRYFPIKVKNLIKSINNDDSLLFEFLTCWFTYFGCYIATMFYLDGTG